MPDYTDEVEMADLYCSLYGAEPSEDELRDFMTDYPVMRADMADYGDMER